MITSTRLWLRHGTALLALGGLVVVHLVLMFTRTGWGMDRAWALGLAAGGTAITVPMLAGVVAFDRARRYEPTLALLSRCSVRGGRSVLGLLLASWLWGVAAWLVAAVVALVAAGRGGAIGHLEPWTFVETPALLALAVAAGYAIGAAGAGQRGWPTAAGPVAAVAVLLVRTLSGGLSFGVEHFLTVPGGDGTKLRLDRDPVTALGLTGLHLAAALGLVAVTLVVTVGVARRPLRLAVGAVAVLLVVGGAVHQRSVSSDRDPYRWTAQARTCLSGAVTVCGPRDAGPLLVIARRTLQEATGRLSGRGIAWQTRYTLVDGRPLPGTSGMLTADPETVRGGRISEDDLLSTLAQPRLCTGLFDQREGLVLADQQRLVMDWAGASLGGRDRTPAPPDVRAAYSTISHCEAMTAALP